MARVSRPATANKIVTVHDPNWDAFAHAAHASQLGSSNYNIHVRVCAELIDTTETQGTTYCLQPCPPPKITSG